MPAPLAAARPRPALVSNPGDGAVDQAAVVDGVAIYDRGVHIAAVAFRHDVAPHHGHGTRCGSPDRGAASRAEVDAVVGGPLRCVERGYDRIMAGSMPPQTISQRTKPHVSARDRVSERYRFHPRSGVRPNRAPSTLDG
jgi:hypothetical protein